MPKINKKLVVTGAIAIFAVGAAGVMLMVKPYIAQAFAAVPPMEELWVTNPDHTYSLALALANPLVTARLVANTIFSNLSYYVKSVAGGVLGYNSIIISDFFVFIFLALIIISVFKMPQENAKISPLRRLLFLVIFFIEFALVVYVGFSWTPIADKTIYGIQGKYLMPAMPLLLLALKNKVFTVTQDIFKPICFVAAFTNIFVVLNAFVIISQR